jgi:hypothetical protein
VLRLSDALREAEVAFAPVVAVLPPVDRARPLVGAPAQVVTLLGPAAGPVRPVIRTVPPRIAVIRPLARPAGQWRALLAPGITIAVGRRGLVRRGRGATASPDVIGGGPGTE